MVFFDQVPLVDYQHDALPGIVDIPGNVSILRGDTVNSIDNQDRDVTSLYRLHRAQDRILFHAWDDRTAFADAGCIDQRVFLSVFGEPGVDCIPGCAGNIADNRALLPGYFVEQAAFTRIRFTNDGDFDAVVLFFIFNRFRELRHYGIQQVTCSGAMDGGDGVWFAHTQGVEVIRVLPGLLAISFVYHQQDRGGMLAIAFRPTST